MQKSSTFLVALLCSLLFSQSLTAQSIRDYRSNVSPTGLWSDVSSRQTWNGSAWVAAASAPTNLSGVVTILAGDSIRMNLATTFDQVIVDNLGILAIFNTGTPTTFTLNDGTGPDIVNNGKLYRCS